MPKTVMIVEDNELNMNSSRPVGSSRLSYRRTRDGFKVPDLAANTRPDCDNLLRVSLKNPEGKSSRS